VVYLSHKTFVNCGQSTMSDVTKMNIAKNLVEKIAELLNAEVRYSYLLDHKGVEQRKISITYKEKNG